MTIAPAYSQRDSSQTLANKKVIRTSRRMRVLETVVVVLRMSRKNRVLDPKYARSITQIRRRADIQSRAMARGEVGDANGGNSETLEGWKPGKGSLGRLLRADCHVGGGYSSTGSNRF